MEKWNPMEDGKPPTPLANTHAAIDGLSLQSADEHAAAAALKVAALYDSEAVEDGLGLNKNRQAWDSERKFTAARVVELWGQRII